MQTRAAAEIPKSRDIIAHRRLGLDAADET
jgi:hypothetical protein